MIDTFIRTQRMVWMAILSSLAALGVVAFVVMPRSGTPAPHFFLAIFVGLAIADLVAVQVLRARLLPRETPASALDDKPPEEDTPEAREALMKLGRVYVLSWALCESVGMFGLVATELLHQPVYYVGFAAVALVFLVLYRPDPDDAAGALRAIHKR